MDKGIMVSGSLGNINGVEFVGSVGIPRGFCKLNASVALYNLYKKDPTDKRFSWSIAGYRNGWVTSANSYQMSYYIDSPLQGDYGSGKYRRWEPKDINALKAAPSARITNAAYTILNNTASATDPNYTSINFPILRYSDVLLMYAEAAIGGKNGSIPASQNALDCLNTVRKRAGLAEFTDTDHDVFFNELVDERMRELCFEGLRKQDLIRWNLLEDKLEESANAIKFNAAYNPNNGTHLVFLSPSKNFDKSKHLSLPYKKKKEKINYSLDQKANW